MAGASSLAKRIIGFRKYAELMASGLVILKKEEFFALKEEQKKLKEKLNEARKRLKKLEEFRTKVIRILQSQ